MKKALELYHIAATQGDADSQWIIGLRYQNGSGVAIDLKKAKDFFRVAASQGHKKSIKAFSLL